MVFSRSLLWSTLFGVDDLQGLDSRIDHAVEVRNFTILRRLIDQCRWLRPFGLEDWKAQRIYDRIVNSLALTQGIDFARMLVEVAQSAIIGGKLPASRLPAAISRLVASQSQHVIEELLAGQQDDEIAALLLYEGVSRGKLSSKSSSACTTHQRISSHNHPLSILPLDLLEWESELDLRSYALTSQGNSPPYFFSDSDLHKSVFLSVTTQSTETTTPDRSKLIASAVLNWQEGSNGKIEARTFRIDCDGSVAPIAAMIPRLELKCTGPDDEISILESPALNKIFAILFSAASNGAAYNHGEDAAYGRLKAWRSIAGLIGLSEITSISEITHRALECEWIIFTSECDWFYQVAWDIGIACYNPASKELAVLAATDTD